MRGALFAVALLVGGCAGSEMAAFLRGYNAPYQRQAGSTNGWCFSTTIHPKQTYCYDLYQDCLQNQQEAANAGGLVTFCEQRNVTIR